MIITSRMFHSGKDFFKYEIVNESTTFLPIRLYFTAGKRMQVDNLSDDELWQSGYLDYSTAKGIFHVVFYYNCVEFEVSTRCFFNLK